MLGRLLSAKMVDASRLFEVSAAIAQGARQLDSNPMVRTCSQGVGAFWGRCCDRHGLDRAQVIDAVTG